MRTSVIGFLYSLVLALSPAISQQLPDPLKPDYASQPLEDWERKFADFTFHKFEEDGRVLPYRLLVPAPIEPGKQYPLVIFMHGAGERGIDNRIQLRNFRSTVEFWKKHPCFVIAPLCPRRDQAPEAVWVDTPFGSGVGHTMKEQPTWPMRLALDAIDEFIATHPVDRHRIYVTGLSMGGFATWEILQRRGKMIAAAVPVCGGADTAFASKLVAIPIWVTHGDADDIVPVSRSRDIIAAIKAARGNPKYTEFPGVKHDAWTYTYSNSEIWDWMFSQVTN
ncbi:MAG: alpha/beta fold hydrolase [Verrucomicrobia bacterium]|nr:alpha/beta fold hydrolase [Verrucomicrobiota bacterium]